MSNFAPRSLYAPVEILSRSEAEEVAKRALKNSPADETRVTINSNARADTRFALNQVTTSGENRDTSVTITAIVNEMKNGKLESRAAGLIATGFIECRAGSNALANSKGLFAYDSSAVVTMTATVRTPDGTGSGWACSDGDTFAEIDAERVGRVAVDKAVKSRNPVAVEPGRYVTILEPTAVGNLVQMIAGAMQARSADEGRSFFSKPGGGNKLGLKVVDERVTLLTDPEDSPSTNGGYDQDGMPLEKVVWIENGIVKNLNYDRYWAQKQGVKPTRAGGGGRGGGNLRMLGGTTSVDEMIKSTERGILVTRFWYIRQTDPRTISFTGLTRDGTFLIENGKITHPVKNFRFNESPIFFLNNLEALGPTVRINASENLGAGGATFMPPIKVKDFTFSSLSDAV